MTAVDYVELPPSPALKPWVECFWFRRVGPSPAAPAPSPEHEVQRVLPDGCSDLIVDLSVCQRGGGGATAVGTMRRALVRRPVPAETLLGVRFRPGRSRSFFGHPLRELTDRTEDAASLGLGIDGECLDRIAAAVSLPERVAALDRWVLGRLAGREPPPRWLAYAVDRIVTAGSRVSVEAIADEAGVTRQALARRFADCVGISPKELGRVARFQRLARLAGPSRPGTGADLATEAGYFDQSHMIAEVRRLAGVTPGKLFAS